MKTGLLERKEEAKSTQPISWDIGKNQCLCWLPLVVLGFIYVLFELDH